jgi:hypothetical protein
VHPHGRVEPVPHRGLVAQVGLEDQAERLPGAGDEVEERLKGGADPLLVVGGGGEGVTDGGGQRLDAVVQQRTGLLTPARSAISSIAAAW